MADQIPGKDVTVDPVVHLTDLPQEDGAKAEGLAVLGSEGNCWDALIVLDGARNGAPRIRRLCRQ